MKIMKKKKTEEEGNKEDQSRSNKLYKLDEINSLPLTRI